MVSGGITSIASNYQTFTILQGTVEMACNLDILKNSIDSRMSSLTFTLGIISNVFS